MSKSKGNIVVPWDVIDRFGADAFRWYFFTSKQPWDGYRFSSTTIGEGVRLFLRQLWNTYGFYVLYANATGRRRARRRADRRSTAGSCSRLGATVEEVTERLEAFDATTAGRAIAAFVDETCRTGTCAARGGASGTATRAAFATLRECLVTVAQLLAPFTPFVADEIYDNLDGSRAERPPVRLARSPASATASSRRRWRSRARRCASGCRRARAAKVKVRQPLREAVVVAAGPRARGDRAPGRRRARGAQRQGAALRRARRRARLLRDQAELPHARPALRQGDAAGRRRGRGARPGARRRRAARRGGPSASPSTATTTSSTRRRPAAARCGRSRATSSSARARTRSRSSSRSTTTCAARGSRARSCTRCRTRARPPGLEVEDRIALTLGGDDELLDAAREHEPLRRPRPRRRLAASARHRAVRREGRAAPRAPRRRDELRTAGAPGAGAARLAPSRAGRARRRTRRGHGCERDGDRAARIGAICRRWATRDPPRRAGRRARRAQAARDGPAARPERRRGSSRGGRSRLGEAGSSSASSFSSGRRR